MTQDSRPFTGTTTGDAGPYGSLEWSDMWSRMFNAAYTGSYGAANRGVWRGVLNELKVQATNPASTSVEILTGGAVVSGKEYDNNATVTQAIAANASGSVRIDIIVLEADYNAQTVRIDVVQGTPAAGVPALTQSAGTLWQMPLAYITLASGFASITDSVITDWRHWAAIPNNIMREITNNSGAVLESGTVVIYDTGTNQITRTTNAGTNATAGVVEARIAIGGTGRIITNGVYEVICDGSVAVGDLLHASATAGQASNAASTSSAPALLFARVMQANSGAGTKALCFINAPVRRNVARVALTHSTTQASPTGAPGAITFDTERWDTDSMHAGGSPTRITFNTAGLYQVSGNVQVSANSILSIGIRLGGATFIANDVTSATGISTLSIHTQYYFDVGNYIELMVQASGAGNINNTSNVSPEFRATWVSE